VYALASKVFSASSTFSRGHAVSTAPPRCLLKIPATPLGIHVAATLESEYSIPTNLTLIFGSVQALACAQAGVSVISPFVGRVKDFYEATGRTIPTKEDGSVDLSQHPGIQLVRRIKAVYKKEGYEGKTKIMAAGFRSVDEIIELGRTGKRGGPDLMTLPPDLLTGLRNRAGKKSDAFSTSTDESISVPTYFTPSGPTPESLARFEADLATEEIALIKVPEGLEKFSTDTSKLDTVIREAILARLEGETQMMKEGSELCADRSVEKEKWVSMDGVPGDIRRARRLR